MNTPSNQIQKISSVSAFFLALGFSLINTHRSSALELRLLPENFGHFDSNGLHFSQSQNYAVGSCGGTITANNVPACPDEYGAEIRNFFLFDTEALSGNNLTSAILSLQNPEINVNVDTDGLYPNPSVLSSFDSDDGFENYQLRRIDSNTDLLIGTDYASGSPQGENIFQDLGNGESYTNSPTEIDDNDNGTFVNISLNQTAIDDILSTERKFAAGGAIDSLTPSPDKLEYAFGFTNPAFRDIGTGAISNQPVSLNLELGEIRLNADRRGFYSETGYHFGNNNYTAGDCRGDLGQCSADKFIDGTDLGGELRNFFTFDLSSIDELIGDYDAFLRIEIPNEFLLGSGDPSQGFASSDPDKRENYILADVTTPIDQLITPDLDGGLPGTDIFSDLGTGVFYSDEFTLTENDLGATKEIPLNINALQGIVDSLGGTFAMSGAIATLNNNLDIADDEYAFGGTNASFGLTGPDSVQLVFRNSVGGGGLSSNLSKALPLGFATTFAQPSPLASASVLDHSSMIDLSSASNIVGVSNEQVIAITINAQAQANSASTPEPSSLVALLGLGALGFVGKNKKKNSV